MPEFKVAIIKTYQGSFCISLQQHILSIMNKGLTNQRNPKFSDPERITKGVFQVIEKHISQGELEDVKASLPGDLLQLWPES